MQKPTFNFAAHRVRGVDVSSHRLDGVFFFRVAVSSIRDPETVTTLNFITDLGGQGRRYASFARALGVHMVLDIDAFPGRVFAMKNNGISPDDFASLEFASACLDADRKAFAAASAYAAEQAEGEEADAAMDMYLRTGIEAFSPRAA
ncbi:hypothetical protein EN868_02990 [Mesorhizobium sp. M2D.F.Ca.ET.225.01.1.1]|uniref:hypothetical protein n=1 Tax=unclassified Mesorhizobium TaxID=325217 RepID=UPI000FD4C422|nr:MULTISPECIES: hypothetical protein [unclassified Mesorhizobium]TGP65431.1 hypothetical protein EN869_002995 [Mesorhizobium sp. M2D.F.Ca.ET.226.01.1.1]TGP71910.1 hypothetical protein EN868_02990 [Mesorhizobium sp. M2D.F.Ca.ET.225.01.1.1]